MTRQLSVAHYSQLDTTPFKPLSFAGDPIEQIVALTKIDKKSAAALEKFRKDHGSKQYNEIPFNLTFDRANSERLRRCLLFNDDKRTIITNAEPVEGRIMSDTKFSLRVSFAGDMAAAPLLISVYVQWKGQPFTVETLVSKRDAAKGYFDVEFTDKQSLPVGPAAFYVTMYNSQGGQSSFRTTCYVLPSNPFKLELSPDVHFVTGTWSARAVKQSGKYITIFTTTLSNGNASAVGMSKTFTWKFWDGGVGGTLIESGTGAFGSSISVPAHGTWAADITVTSPSGSGIYDQYQNRNDMTIEIIMTKSAGGTVSATITARTMFKFGMNITKVSPRDFVDNQTTDLHDAAAVTRSIYEKRDVTIQYDYRFIPDASVGGFEVIDTDGEAHDMWDQWSGPNTNNNIDAFITHVWIDGKYDGMDGAIPGPTSHSGSDSGVVADKAAYVDSGGKNRLHVEYLGMLMGHEVGHYLGLSHISTAKNLMLYNSGTTDTTITYDQYETIIQHGWVSID